jgi:hypothetical protein
LTTAGSFESDRKPVPVLEQGYGSAAGYDTEPALAFDAVRLEIIVDPGEDRHQILLRARWTRVASAKSMDRPE